MSARQRLIEGSVAVPIAAIDGSFTLSFAGQTTNPIAWNADIATVIIPELEALPTIGAGNIDVHDVTSGGHRIGLRFDFQGALAGTPVNLMTVGTSLIQTATPIVTNTTTTGIADQTVTPSSSSYSSASAPVNQVLVFSYASASMGTIVFNGPTGGTTLDPTFTNNAGAIQSSLATPCFGGSNINVTGTDPYYIEVNGAYAGTNVSFSLGTNTTDTTPTLSQYSSAVAGIYAKDQLTYGGLTPTAGTFDYTLDHSAGSTTFSYSDSASSIQAWVNSRFGHSGTSSGSFSGGMIIEMNDGNFFQNYSNSVGANSLNIPGRVQVGTIGLPSGTNSGLWAMLFNGSRSDSGFQNWNDTGTDITNNLTNGWTGSGGYPNYTITAPANAANVTLGSTNATLGKALDATVIGCLSTTIPMITLTSDATAGSGPIHLTTTIAATTAGSTSTLTNTRHVGTSPHLVTAASNATLVDEYGSTFVIRTATSTAALSNTRHLMTAPTMTTLGGIATLTTMDKHLTVAVAMTTLTSSAESFKRHITTAPHLTTSVTGIVKVTRHLTASPTMVTSVSPAGAVHVELTTGFVMTTHTTTATAQNYNRPQVRIRSYTLTSDAVTTLTTHNTAAVGARSSVGAAVLSSTRHLTAAVLMPTQAVGSLSVVRHFTTTINIVSSIVGNATIPKRDTTTITIGSSTSTATTTITKKLTVHVAMLTSVAAVRLTEKNSATFATTTAVSGNPFITRHLTPTFPLTTAASGATKNTRHFAITFAAVSSIVGSETNTRHITTTIAGTTLVSGVRLSNVRHITTTIAATTSLPSSGGVVIKRKTVSIVIGSDVSAAMLTDTKKFQVSFSIRSAVSGTETNTRKVVSTFSAITTAGNSTLANTRKITTQINLVSSVSGAERLTRKLLTTIAVRSSVVGVEKITRHLAGTITILSSVTDSRLSPALGPTRLWTMPTTESAWVLPDNKIQEG